MEKIQAQLIFEIIGKPKEHIVLALNDLIDKMGKDNGVKVIERTVHEPVPAKDLPEIFTTFAEVTVELDTTMQFFAILFSYFPANVQILSPQALDIPLETLNEVGNALVHRLHEYDALVKGLYNERQSLLAKLKDIAPSAFMQLVQPFQPSSTETKQNENEKIPKEKPIQEIPQNSEKKSTRKKSSKKIINE